MISNYANPILSNILLVSGTGRNVGKTTFICQVISKFKLSGIVGIKISPHAHSIDTDSQILLSDNDFLIGNETKLNTSKDSSRMLRAGASQVFYIQATDIYLPKVMEFIHSQTLSTMPIVCESAALHTLLPNALHLRITNGTPHKSTQLSANRWIENTDGIFNFDFSTLTFENSSWSLQTEKNFFTFDTINT